MYYYTTRNDDELSRSSIPAGSLHVPFSSFFYVTFYFAHPAAYDIGMEVGAGLTQTH